MTILLIFAFAAFSLFALYMMLAPFLASDRDRTRVEVLQEEIYRIEQLLARRQVLLRSLRDLEFEYETAKIDREDYERFKRIFELEAVGVMRQLDAIHGGRGWEAQIDEELVRRLGTKEPQPVAADGADEADVHVIAAAAEGEGEGEGEGVDEEAADLVACAECHTDLAPDDRFCRQCGTPVVTEPEARPVREVGR